MVRRSFFNYFESIIWWRDVNETKPLTLVVEYCHKNRAIVNGNETHDIVNRLVDLSNDHRHSPDPSMLAQMGASLSGSQKFRDTFSSFRPDHTS